MKVVLLGLANHAHPDGRESYPVLETLARYAHCDRSTAKRNVRKLSDAGWIKNDGYGPKGQAKYRLAMGRPFDKGGQNAPGGTGDDRGGALAPPEPSLGTVPVSFVEGDRGSQPQELRLIGAASAAPPARVSAREGVRARQEIAERLLAEFNAATASRLRPRRGDGQPSPHLVMICRRLNEHEDVSEADWVRAIRNTVANPPGWLDGDVIVSTVFGPKAAMGALANQGRHVARDSRGDGWSAEDMLRLGGAA